MPCADRAEARDVGTRRGDAEREPLPPVLERGVLDLHRDGAVDDFVDSSRAKEVGQVAGPAAGADGPALDLGIERPGCIPERADRAAVAEVPHAGGDGAALPASTLAISRRPATGSSMTLTTS